MEYTSIITLVLTVTVVLLGVITYRLLRRIHILENNMANVSNAINGTVKKQMQFNQEVTKIVGKVIIDVERVE